MIDIREHGGKFEGKIKAGTGLNKFELGLNYEVNKLYGISGMYANSYSSIGTVTPLVDKYLAMSSVQSTSSTTNYLFRTYKEGSDGMLHPVTKNVFAAAYNSYFPILNSKYSPYIFIKSSQQSTFYIFDKRTNTISKIDTNTHPQFDIGTANNSNDRYLKMVEYGGYIYIYNFITTTLYKMIFDESTNVLVQLASYKFTYTSITDNNGVKIVGNVLYIIDRHSNITFYIHAIDLNDFSVHDFTLSYSITINAIVCGNFEFGTMMPDGFYYIPYSTYVNGGYTWKIIKVDLSNYLITPISSTDIITGQISTLHTGCIQRGNKLVLFHSSPIGVDEEGLTDSTYTPYTYDIITGVFDKTTDKTKLLGMTMKITDTHIMTQLTVSGSMRLLGVRL